jgi:hypothetical protein
MHRVIYRSRFTPILPLLLTLSAQVAAHHSFAMFDAKNPIILTGEVKEYQWVNPHAWVLLSVKNEDGSEAVWQLEHGPKNMLTRQGWTSTTLESGDMVSVTASPLHNGKPGAKFVSFEFVDGEETDLKRESTIFRIPRPEPVEMAPDVAKNFNGLWVNAVGGIHFDSAGSRAEQIPPLRPEYMVKWEQRRADAAVGKSTNDPTSQCIHPGFPRFLGMVYPGEILQTDHQINWYAEWGEATVRIFLDGRDPPADLMPSYNGFTTGAWEGNTLVTRTISMRDDTLVDTTGVPHSEQLVVTMRMEKLTPDHLEVAITLEDPIVFEEPWKTVKRYARAPEHFSIQEFSCFEGNRYRYAADGSVEIEFQNSEL